MTEIAIETEISMNIWYRQKLHLKAILHHYLTTEDFRGYNILAHILTTHTTQKYTNKSVKFHAVAVCASEGRCV